MLRISWGPQVAILSISHTVPGSISALHLLGWEQKCSLDAPICSRRGQKPGSFFYLKHRLKRCELTINRSKPSATRSVASMMLGAEQRVLIG